jgi:GTP pyrophosphokinase
VAAVKSLLENMLKKQEVEYLSVTGRVKTRDGAIEKINRKAYPFPQEQLTDLSGIRVITYLEQQVGQISTAIRGLFEVDDRNSLDRTQVLGDDKVGYRSTHFVCTLGKRRDGLPEYEALGDLKFEIQVRTVLQHAWAELAHDRSFKFGSALPTKIQRKLNLYSGMLEIVDSAFDDISKEVDLYRVSLEKKSIEQISGTEVDSISLEKYIQQMQQDIEIELIDKGITPSVVAELKAFDAGTVGDVAKLCTKDFLKAFNDHQWLYKTSIGLLRDLMMYHDIEKYLRGPFTWRVLTSDTFNFLAKKYGKTRLRKLLSEREIRVESKAASRNRLRQRPGPAASTV